MLIKKQRLEELKVHCWIDLLGVILRGKDEGAIRACEGREGSR